jgi:hypothetical protein
METQNETHTIHIGSRPFWSKCVGQEHAEHLKRVLEENYKVTADWNGEIYAGSI